MKTQELSQKFGTLRSTGKIERLVSILNKSISVTVPLKWAFVRLYYIKKVQLLFRTVYLIMSPYSIGA